MQQFMEEMQNNPEKLNEMMQGMNADEKNDEFKSNAQVIDIDPEDEDDLAALKSVKAGGGRDIFADPKKVHASKTEMQDSAKAIFSSHKAPKSKK